MKGLKKLENIEELIKEIETWENPSDINRESLSWQEVIEIFKYNPDSIYFDYDKCPDCGNERIFLQYKIADNKGVNIKNLLICRNCKSQEIDDNIRSLTFYDKNSPETLEKIESIKEEIEVLVERELRKRKEIIEELEKKIDEKLSVDEIKKHLQKKFGDEWTSYQKGIEREKIKKQILKEFYGIEWFSFLESNPHIMI